MNIKNCRKCGKIYNYIAGQNICPACREAVEARFHDVKNYIYENKGSGIAEISEACEIEKAQIQQWIREERLVFSDDSPIGIECEVCGTMIRTGRFCQKCKNDMTNNLNSGMKPKEPNPFEKNNAASSSNQSGIKLRNFER